ncbi:MAG TPA: alpha-galactosidase [Bryocella sp.]|nr:alpha-galactosidase [Bryocella sp.]
MHSKMTLRCTSLFSLLLAISTAISAQRLDDSAQSRRWVLDNGVVRKAVSYSPQYGLETQEWSDLISAHAFVLPGSIHHGFNEFRVSADGKPVSGKSSDVHLKGATESTSSDGTAQLAVWLEALHAPVEVIVHYELAKGEPAVRQFLEIRNTGSTPVVLQHLTVANGLLSPGPEKELVAYGGYGEQPRETYFTGRVNDVAVLLEDAKTGIGFAVLSEVPGYMKRTELGQIGWSQWTPAFSAMYDTDLFPFRRTVAPGEVFKTAGVSVLFYQRGTASDPHWRIPEYVRDRIAINRRQVEPWIYNTWEPFHKDISAALVAELMRRAAAMGFTLFTLDDGWELRYGDNTVDTKKFPDGLDPLFAQAHQLGLERGLWSPLALIDLKSHDFLQHPEWACHEPDGSLRYSNSSGIVLSLASPYKYAVIDRISDLVKRYDLSYVKLDLTTVFNAYGEQPGCFEKREEYSTPQESSERIYESLDLIANTLHERFPKLLIDYTFELWGEKHLIDYGLLRVADLDWMSNVVDRSADDAGPLQVRTLLYQRGMAIPVNTMLIGNLQAEMPSWQDHATTAMGAGPVFLGDLRRVDAKTSAAYRDWIDRYKRLRASAKMSDSFFPLGSWRQPRMDQWDGFARLARTGDGMVVLFRNQSSATNVRFRIPGYPDGQFRVTSWSTGETWIVSGKALKDTLEVRFPSGQDVEVIELHPVSTK